MIILDEIFIERKLSVASLSRLTALSRFGVLASVKGAARGPSQNFY